MRIGILLLTFCAIPSFAQENLLDTLTLTEVGSGFEAPTSIVNAGDGSGRLFVTEREGRIWALDRDHQRGAEPFLDIRDRVSILGGSEQGLLSAAFHPSFGVNGRFFVNYTGQDGGTVVSEFRVTDDPDAADSATEQVFFSVAQPFNNHNGGQLQFGPDGMLYIGTGDGGGVGDPSNNAQNLETPLGKMLRFDVDQGAPARAPADNPFVGVAGAEPGIWAVGLRNPWRFSFDRETGDLWIGDVGQNLWEEVDFAPAGAAGLNYGWRRMEGRHCFDPSSNCDDGTLTLPVIEYSHAGSPCSVTGGYRYRGALHPSLYGVYFFADYCSFRLEAAVETSEGVFERLEGRSLGISVTTFGEDEAGEIYYADYFGGVIYRIDAPTATPSISQGGVVNAASFAPGEPVAPGSIVSVFGEALASGSFGAAGAPLPTVLGDSGFTFDGGLAAPLFFVSPGQANLQVPWELAGLESAQLTAAVNGLASGAAALELAAVQPGIFTMDQSGSGQAAALIAGAGLLAAPSDEFSSARPAQPGETLEIYATGLGPVSNPPATGAASPADPLAETSLDVLVRVGDGEPAPAQFAGLAPGYVGLYQVNVELGDAPSSGPRVPLMLTVGEVESNAVTVAIE